MNFKKSFFCWLLVSAGLLQAQSDFKPGFIIQHSGDTLFGKIDNRGDISLGESCHFKSINSEVKVFSPSDIAAFRFINGKYFVSREIKGTLVFLEFLINGKISIFYLRDLDGDHYYIDKEGIGLVEVPYEKKVIYKNDVGYNYESTRHIGFLTFYMQDAPDLKAKIMKIKKPEHENMIKLAEDYHNEVCKSDSCIIYSKSTAKVKAKYEIAAGIVMYSDATNLHGYLPHFGVISHLWLPRVNEKLYFKTGVVFITSSTAGTNSLLFKFPLQMEYIYPKGNIRPRIAMGYNYYFPLFFTLDVSPGVIIKASKKISVTVSSDVEFIPFLKILPVRLLSTSLNLGVLFKF